MLASWSPARQCLRTATVSLLAVTFAFSLPAQNVISVRAGGGGRTLVAPGAKVMIPIVIDMSADGGGNLATMLTGIDWSATRLTFDSVTSAGFGLLTANTTNGPSGSVAVTLSAVSATANTVTMANLFLTASAAPGGTTVALSPTLATNASGSNILNAIRIRNLDVCVASTTWWGDVNVDGNVDILDAQQIARSSIGLSVANPAAVASQGDVTGDGSVDIIDAQQVSRYSVGLSAAARINTPVSPPSPVATLSIASVFAATAGSVNPGVPANTAALAVGTQAQIRPLARDASGTDVTACAPITYSSNAPSVTVSADGLIVAAAAGTAVITVAAGTATTQISVTVPGVPANTYTTSFSLTENPMSEGGRWLNGGTVGMDWTNVSTTPGRAIGHQVGASFTDATALLTGAWGPNQTASATVFATSQNDACFQEVELRLRSVLAAHVSKGYEISFKSSQSASAYLIIVRWNGALGDFTYLFSEQGTQFGVRNGDVVKASVVGNVITAFKNGVQLAQVTDNSFGSGSPGIGFNLENAPSGCAGTNGNYGFTHYTVTDGPGQ